MTPQHLSLTGWFLLGISAGLGPCFGHSLLVLLPYIGMSREGTVKALWEVVSFSLGRGGSYAVLGAAAGLTGRTLRAVASPVFSIAAEAAFGGLMMTLALVVLFSADSGACRLLHERLNSGPGRAMFLAGALTALTPCPLLLGLLSSAAASASTLYGLLSGFTFAAGSVISPVLLLGPLLGFIKGRAASRRLARITRFLGALLLFGYGVHMVVNALL